MSVLPVGRSLRQFLPDVDEFLLDPASYLGAAPVEIGPRRAYGLAALFGAFGAACLAACAISGNWHDERLLLATAARAFAAATSRGRRGSPSRHDDLVPVGPLQRRRCPGRAAGRRSARG